MVPENENFEEHWRRRLDSLKRELQQDERCSHLSARDRVKKLEEVFTLQRLLSGWYEKHHGDILGLESVADPLLADAICGRLVRCRPGQGEEYERRVDEALSYALDYIVDADDKRRQVANEGGKLDMYFPVRSERSGRYGLWHGLLHRYRMVGIPVECKNLTKKASVRAADQLFFNLRSGQFGRFGIVASRSGFSDPCMQRIASENRRGDYCMLPLDNGDLQGLVLARVKGIEDTMVFLRKKIQAAISFAA